MSDVINITDNELREFVFNLVDKFKSWNIDFLDFTLFTISYDKFTDSKIRYDIIEILEKFKLTVFETKYLYSPTHYIKNCDIIDLVFNSGLFNNTQQDRIASIIDKQHDIAVNELHIKLIENNVSNDSIEFVEDLLLKNNIRTVDDYNKYRISELKKMGLQYTELKIISDWVKILIEKLNRPQQTSMN